MKFSTFSVIAASFAIHATAGAAIYAYPNKASLYAAIHADYVGSTGLATGSLTARNPVNANNGFGRTLTIDSNYLAGQHLVSWSTGVGAPNPANVTTVSSNVPSRAFGCYLHVANNSNQSVGGQVTIDISGEQLILTIPAGGMYVGVATFFEFNSVTINAIAGNLVEMIDDVTMASLCGRAASDTSMDAGPARLGNNFFNTTYVADDQFDFRFGTNYGNTHDVWWNYVPTEAGTLVADTQGTNFDTLLGIYQSSEAPPFDAVFPAAFNDDISAANVRSHLEMHVTAGQRYYIRVGGKSGARGTGNLNLTFTPDCLADYNHDGAADFFDYLDFVNTFSAGCP